jgi:predicted signal transduction protein with EAL and GGDEF domain
MSTFQIGMLALAVGLIVGGAVGYAIRVMVEEWQKGRGIIPQPKRGGTDLVRTITR